MNKYEKELLKLLDMHENIEKGDLINNLNSSGRAASNEQVKINGSPRQQALPLELWIRGLADRTAGR